MHVPSVPDARLPHRDTTAMSSALYVAGMGCRKGSSCQQLLDLLLQALQRQGLQPADLHSLASSTHKQDEPGLQQLAEHLQLPLSLLPGALLEGYHTRLSQHSPLSLQITGSAGVAEASALALAESLSGQPAQLLSSKIRSATATCALAVALRP